MVSSAIFAVFGLLSILAPTIDASCGLNTNVDLTLLPTSIITSPNYPSNYPSSNTVCKWLITAPFGYKVKINFTTFDIYGSRDCRSDYVAVYDGSFESSSSSYGKYCGESLPPTLISSERYMYLTFYAKYSRFRSNKGFRVEVSPVDKVYCGSLALMASTSSAKVITTPNYPYRYPPSTSCKWRITAPSDSYVIQLKFIKFNTYGSFTGECPSKFHRLDIYDSSSDIKSKVLGQYCGNDVPANVVSSGKYLYLSFSTPSSTSYLKSGFKIEYKAVKAPSEDYSSCSAFNSYSTNNNIQLKASRSYKYIKSPYYPNKYPSNVQCTWVISASSSSNRVQLTITDVKIQNYHSTCSSTADTLTIRDGSSPDDTQLKQVCSTSSSSSTVRSTGQKLWIQFKTNSDNYFSSSSKAGFQAKFIEVEGSISVGMIVGIIFCVVIFIGVIICCICNGKRRRNAGHIRSSSTPAVSVETTTTRPTPEATPQYPLQQVGLPPAGSYPPKTGGRYPPYTRRYPPADVRETPPPAYPGPLVYPTQSNEPYNPQFQGTQPNPPPQGNENQAAVPYPVTSQDTKPSAPPLNSDGTWGTV